MQVAVTVCQAIVDPSDLAAASAMALFFQLLGGAVWVSVAQNIFANKLIQSLNKKLASPSLTAEIVAAGATELRKILSGEELTTAIGSYMDGLKDAFILMTAVVGAAVVVTVACMVFDRRKLRKSVQVAGAA
jgi:MFS transporter, DHA2 family, glioxin efflux transporter